MNKITPGGKFDFLANFKSEIEILTKFCHNSDIPGFEIYNQTGGNGPGDHHLWLCYQWGKVSSENNHPFSNFLLDFVDENGAAINKSNTLTSIREHHLMAYPLCGGNQHWYFIVYHMNPEICDSSQPLVALETMTQFLKLALINRLKLDALLAEKVKYSHLFSAAPEGIVMLDTQNRILEVNPEFEHMFQYSANEIIGCNIDDLIAPGSYNEEARLLSISNWTGNQVVVETKRMRRDGTMVEVSVMGVPFYHTDGQLRVFGIYRDISGKVKTQLQTQRWIEFIEYISQLSSNLINLDISNLDASINDALKKVSTLYGAERVYIACFESENELIKLTHEYTLDPRFSHLQVIPFIPANEIKEFIGKLEKGEMIHLQRTNLATDISLNELLYYFDLLNVETLVAVPLIGENRFLGYIGFDTYSRPAQWHENTLNAFQLTAQIIANALTRKDKDGALKNALTQAEASDKLKSAFLASISHEIRTPMNHILGFLELLNEPDISMSDRTEYLSIIKTSSKKLLQLLDDVIKTALIDSGQLSYRPGPTHLVRFMESLLIEAEGAKTVINRTNVKFNLVVEPGMCNELIETDEVKLKQILLNLLTNALKYTTEGIIDFGFTCTQEKIEFFVSDTGIGIDEVSQPLVFERFHRIDNDFNREFGGAGLGLSISQGLAGLLGGTIQVISTPGCGATFTFSIPYVVYQLPVQAFPGKKSYDWKGKKILMVEDDPINMRFLAVMLLRTNADLLYAGDGAEAVKMVESQHIDLVLMDMQLPVMDGFEATRRIKQVNATLPVIAQTAMALRAEKQKCLDAGCDDYLSKPITRQQLYEVIDKLLTEKV
ncbi:MAG: response regulator [Lentimicrobiaceae bacterium]|jgi:PAS domain S-box-containing protein|nr:response regulator [Lentimicrobiaceae bacterium]MDD4597748.1 response regulator [Lentimicrobiaceae bacterium]